jgi:hypothetical protein
VDAGIRDGSVTSMLWVRSLFTIGAEAKQRIIDYRALNVDV